MDNMDSLLRTSKGKSLDRGKNIRPNETFTQDDLKKESKKEQITKTESVTYYANIRINNHIRNQLQSLSLMGLAKSQKGALELLINEYVNGMPEELRREYELNYKTLEDRDVKLKANKWKVGIGILFSSKWCLYNVLKYFSLEPVLCKLKIKRTNPHICII